MPDLLVDGIYTEPLMENTQTHVQNNVDTEEDGYRLYTVRVLFKNSLLLFSFQNVYFEYTKHFIYWRELAIAISQASFVDCGFFFLCWFYFLRT